MVPRDLISIGKISGTHGYNGVIKVLPLTDFPERFNKLKKVKVTKANTVKELTIDYVKPYKTMLLIKFTEINTKEDAQLYNNALLQVEPKDVYELPAGYYYHFQLLGMNVFDTEIGLIGKIKEILETGSNDVYVVDSPQYGEVLIPALKEVIIDVNVDRKEMQVKLLPGLLEK
ncbi:MAG: ribosome maturation factor RimM [Syntrophomonadaceae bacterium]|jgi:16S rRNA processing protein RimM